MDENAKINKSEFIFPPGRKRHRTQRSEKYSNANHTVMQINEKFYIILKFGIHRQAE